jgi:hypothetical protein
MAVADFEEKTYEIAYDVEMSKGGGPTPWAPGQVLEHLVGFDAAANPDPSHQLWRVLGAPRPKGLVLLPNHWLGLPGRLPSRRQLPSDPVSFMVQFKRPEFIRSHAGKQWKLWGTPYYRFKIDPAQQRTLKRLEANTSGAAIVRYAAPAFSTNQAMDRARMSDQVITSSGHVAPSVMTGHAAWTYVAAGSAGRPNPTGEEHRFDQLSDLFREPDGSEQLQSPGTTTDIAAFDALGVHIEVLARAALAREPNLRRTVNAWRRELIRENVSPATIASVVNFGAVQSLMSRIGASWWVFDRDSLTQPAP